MEIRNKHGEKLEVLIEGAEIDKASQVLVMVHGFGTSLHERGLFDDIVKTLTSNHHITTVRFSWPGFGKSEGKQEETDLYKVAECTQIIIEYVLKHKQKSAKLNLLAHSMANQALTYALDGKDYPIDLYIAECPSVYRRGEDAFEKWKKRPNTVVDKDDILITPRADGTITRIGPGYWKSIDPEAYQRLYPEIVQKYHSILVRALDDQIVDNSSLKKLPFDETIELYGGHSFSKPEDRKIFLKKLSEVLNKNT